MSDYVLTRSGSVIDFGPMAKGAWARVYSNGSWIPWVGMPDSLVGSRPLSEKEAIKLTSPDVWLNKSAEATFDLLLEGLQQAKIMDSMFDCYHRYFMLYGQINDLKPRKIKRSDRDRLLFEILCYTTFTIVVRVVPSHIAGKFSAENHGGNSQYIFHFNQKLLACLDKFFRTQKITAVRELVINGTSSKAKCGHGERMDAAKRIASYLNAGSIEEELRIFSDSVGCAIDPLNLQITEIIGLSHSGMILDIVSRTLNAVFEK